VTIFLDLVELGSSNATSILSSLMHCLNCHCFSEQFICDYLVGIATDGASAMLGRKAGVCKLLSDKRPGIVVWHCLAHRHNVARKYLTISASSVPVESMFSTTGLLLNSKRSSLAPHKLNYSIVRLSTLTLARVGF